MVRINKIEPESYQVEIQGTSNVVANELSNGLLHFMKIMNEMGVERDIIISVIEQMAQAAITRFDLYLTTDDIDL